jgi:outer membrane protein OmpA-like peptidoglycan-associated protein
MQRFKLLFLFYFCSNIGFAQEAILFEDFEGTPSTIRVLGTPDFHNSPQKILPQAYSGKGYEGIVYSTHDYETEAFALPLTKAMTKDITYKIQFQARSSKYLGSFQPNTLSIWLPTITPSTPKTLQPALLDSITIKIPLTAPLSCDKWTMIQTFYKAKGGEKFICFGMHKQIFDKSNKAKELKTEEIVTIDKVTTSIGQLFVDWVLIKPMNGASLPEASTFDYGKSLLKPEAFTALDEWIRRLNENPSTQIKITGYTDNQGSEELNLNLSKARALAVGQYLNTKGIERKRISLEGLGNQNPIESNDTEQGRTKNRRVEIEIVNPY